MKSRIEELLDKYWEGETSLAEEKELRNLVLNAEGYEKEKALFSALGQFRSLEPQQLSVPKTQTRSFSPQWLRWAASIAMLLGTYWGWSTYQQKQAEQQAYKEVMGALAMIQSNLSKGQQQMTPLSDLKYLNTTHKLFQLDQIIEP
ncbi:hypothetical protein GCM10009119_22680 [Algoriphagus jejuensis]|uniref:Anti-sigma factor n=1 Tax=Algoriphagus jejuensis TaxID=419934 RepID=A0ABP3YEV6_9BACT